MGKGGVFLLRNLMRRVVRVLWIITIMVIIGIIPWMMISMAGDGYSPHGIAQTVAVVFALGACLLSIWLMAMHLDNLNAPRLQYPILRILLMVPIYALNCWLSLMFQELSIYMDCGRKIYEAFVINQFFVYLTIYLGEDDEIAVKLRKKGDTMQGHIFPMSTILSDWDAEHFVDGCRTGVNFYVITRVVTSIFELLLQPFGLYQQGHLHAESPYLWFTILNNFAACWAIYCLVIFGVGLERELRPVNPLGKFLCIKAVVFFTWWQSVMLVLVEDAGLLEHPTWTKLKGKEVAIAVQNFCICIEMLFVALVHTWTFSYKEFRAPPRPGEDDDEDTCCARAVSMFDFRDIGQDVMQTTRHPVMPEVDHEALQPLLNQMDKLAKKSPRLEPVGEGAVEKLADEEQALEGKQPGDADRVQDVDSTEKTDVDETAKEAPVPH